MSRTRRGLAVLASSPESAKGQEAAGFQQRGVEPARQRQLDQIISDATQAIQVNPKDVNAYTNRGAAYAQKGEFDKAIADFNEMIRLDPKSADAYMDRGRAWAAKGEQDKAASDYQQAELLRKGP